MRSKNKVIIAISISVILFSVIGGQNNVSFAESNPDHTHAPDKLLVKFKPNDAASHQNRFMKFPKLN